MRIQESMVGLSATHEASRSHSVSNESEIGFRRVFASVSEAAPDPAGELRQRIQQVLESLVAAIMAAIDGHSGEEKLAAGSPLTGQQPAAPTPDGSGWQLTWRNRVTERLCEAESTRVCGQGIVSTADGREIAFDFAVGMQRELRLERVIEESGSVELRDPLVLSYPGKSCELENRRFEFDLDADGVAEWLPELASGSCFLVFDANGNGRADNGQELFGTRSGNGFSDLAGLDSDGNGWIDEADPAFGQLALWSGDSFTSLAAGGVGALHTAAVDAPFSLKTGDNQLLGQIRSAGVYLLEDGQAGLLQQVDLATSAGLGGAQEPEQRQELSA